MTCRHCDDGDGNCAYPYYGVAPHVCGFRVGRGDVGGSVQLPEAEWPANFEPDPETAAGPGEYPGCGTYTHCLHCGAGMER